MKIRIHEDGLLSLPPNYPYCTWSSFLKTFKVMPSGGPIINLARAVIDNFKSSHKLKRIWTEVSGIKEACRKNLVTDSNLFVHPSLPFWIKDSPSNIEGTVNASYYFDVNNKAATLLAYELMELRVFRDRPPMINFLCQEPGLSLKEVEIRVPDFDIGLHYGESFKAIHEHILNSLLTNKDKPGLILLHGKPGTGKTFYIRALLKLASERRMIYVPPHVANAISSPQFLPFMLDNKNPVLIIEDAELILQDRKSGGSAVSNLLNLTDGILADALTCQVICTFNIEKTDVDTALLRNGRLIAEHYFDLLPKDEANKLLSHLGKSEIATNAMSLADIYNQEALRTEAPEHAPIGFTT